MDDHPYGPPGDPRRIDLTGLAGALVRRRNDLPASRALLAAVSGIDASGKGWVSERLAAGLERAGLRTALIHADGWLHLPGQRFAPIGDPEPARHFWRHAFRFAALFEQLVTPLRDCRSVDLVADFAEETATAYRPHRWCFRNVDVLVLEAIFLLQPALRARCDVAVWIECSFATALERALARAQEGLPPDATRRAYEALYFPAQRLHLAHDRPLDLATWLVANDPRLGDVVPA